jgi:hypothetical protein
VAGFCKHGNELPGSISIKIAGLWVKNLTRNFVMYEVVPKIPPHISIFFHLNKCVLILTIANLQPI